MKQYQFTVTSQCIEAPKCAAFVSGSAEIYEAVFSFDSYWDGFARTAVFECGAERREQLLVNDRCIVPWEILKAGAYLRVGVYGVNGYATMPTVYSGTMFVARGAEPSEAAREHSPDVFDQIVEIGQQAAQDAESAADSAQAAASSASDAENAKTAAETAQRAAEEAQRLAGIAKTAAEMAASSASGSATSAEAAKTAAEAAHGAAEAAQTAAEAAAQAAALYAGAAGDHASAAQAAASASLAAQAAAEAAQSASAASATAAEGSATNAETAAAVAKEAKDAWESMSAEAETLPAGTPATASYEGGVLSLGIPAGADGVSPTITSTSITGGHRLTITDVDGTRTVDVLDGEDGEDGKSIYAGSAVPTTDGYNIGDLFILLTNGQVYELDDEPLLRWRDTNYTIKGKSAYASAQDGGYTGTEEQFNRDLSGVGDLSADVQEIEGKIPSAASSTNKLVSASEMGDAIEAVEAKQLYATAQQGSFATKAALTGATTYYNADGTVATPTKNDVAYVLADESHDGKSAKYVIANKPTETVPPVWGFVISFSDNTFSQAQMDAINSGVTSAKRDGYDSHVVNRSNPHNVTKEQVGLGHVRNLALYLNEKSSMPESATLEYIADDTTGVRYDVPQGTYSKPSEGIPKTDLASSVQTSLGKADSALQQHQSLAAYRTAEAQDTIDATKETKGKITIGGVEKTANTHTVTIVTNGVTSTFTLVGVQ